MGCFSSKKSKDDSIDLEIKDLGIREEDIIPADAIGMHKYQKSNHSKALSEKEFLEGLNQKKFQKIAIMTGAGISVAAGIPDFRTPGTGLYHTVQKLKLPKPEALFSIDFFKKQPEKFYTFAKQFMKQSEVNPVKAHKFIAQLEKQGILLRCYTQNIDGLELKAGLSKQKITQAHGNLDSAKCVKCHEECDRKLFRESVDKGKVLKCKDCKVGLIKPNIVFYGEALDDQALEQFEEIRLAYLVIVMGTSLKVSPFNMLVEQVKCPIVIINRENPLEDEMDEKPILFIQGDIENIVSKVCQGSKFSNVV